MKVTVERLPQSAVRLDIAADPEEFERAFERAFRRINQQVAIPGFRPGRAPRALVERRLGREVIVHEAHHELMDQLYRKALEQEDLTPVSEPVVEVYQDEPLAFRVEVQVYPRVELNDYRSVRVEPREVSVTDDEIDQVIEDLRKSQSVWVEPEQPRHPTSGDQVTIDLQAFEGDEPFQSPLEGMPFVLGESSLFPQIEEAIRNLLPGESAEFDIAFAEDDERVNPDLRGKTLHYKVTLREVKERELPELDDEFARSVGDFQTLDELRQRIRDDLLRQKALAARSEVLNEAVEKVTEQATVEVPPALVERQVELQIERLREDLRQQGSSLEEYLRLSQKSLEDLKAELRPGAEQRLRQSLVLETFAKIEGIEVSEEDLVQEIERLSSASENPEQMRSIYGSPYFRDLIGDELQTRKVTERLIEIVTEGRGAVLGEAARLLEAEETAVEVEEVEGEDGETRPTADMIASVPAEPADASEEEETVASAGEPEEETEEPVTAREEARETQ
ncbi:trigger factor [Thermomicrobiaceae bacterium CFH 74404]|uniref:Trigger factor n=1 Tax=Thermalbibacter longus TaxID=2951981 RepID=A0AA41WAN0_9BACT|nr:trigger factor [Thermalbibacter longus]MCM8748857.1 trigger factor [Thermalbibacter longus]